MATDGGPSGPDSSDDALLFELARGGDTGARNELVKRHVRSMRAIAEAYGSCGANAKDLIKGAFSRIDSVDPPHSAPEVRLVLFGLLRQTAFEAARITGSPAPSGLIDFGIDADATTADAGAKRSLFEAFGTLTEQEQAMLWFVAVEGLTPVDLAARLPIGSVDVGATSSFRARSHLRHAYVTARSRSEGWPQECAQRARDISALFVDGAIRDPFAADSTRAHVASCDHCQKLLAELSQINGLVMAAAAPAARPPGTPFLVATPPSTVVAGSAVPPANPTLVATEPFLNADEDDDRPRRRAPLVVAGVVALLVVIGLVVLLVQRMSDDNNQQAATLQSVASTTTQRLSVATSLQRTVPTVMTPSTTTPHSTTTARHPTSTTSIRHGGSTPPSGTASPPTQGTAPATQPPVTTPPVTTAPAPRVTATVDAPSSSPSTDGMTRTITVVNSGTTAVRVTVTINNATPYDPMPPDWICGLKPGETSVVVCTSDDSMPAGSTSDTLAVHQSGSTDPTVSINP